MVASLVLDELMFSRKESLRDLWAWFSRRWSNDKTNLIVSHKFLEIASRTCQVESKAENLSCPRKTHNKKKRDVFVSSLKHACGIDFEVEFSGAILPVLFKLWNQKKKKNWLVYHHEIQHKERGPLSLHLILWTKNSAMAVITGFNKGKSTPRRRQDLLAWRKN